MSEHHESNTPRYVAYLAAVIVVLFVGVLAYNTWFAPSDAPGKQAPVTTNAGAIQVELMLKDGPVFIDLRPDLAPKHVAQIVSLIDDGFYDGIVFHRVIEGFMAQTGDPTGTGMGGSELPDIEAEFSGETFARGTVGMARSQSPNSANSQFFIMFAPAPHLDGQYTIVGQVTSGMEFVDAIKMGAPEANGTVTEPDSMISLKLAE